MALTCPDWRPSTVAGWPSPLTSSLVVFLLPVGRSEHTRASWSRPPPASRWRPPFVLIRATETPSTFPLTLPLPWPSPSPPSLVPELGLEQPCPPPIVLAATSHPSPFRRLQKHRRNLLVLPIELRDAGRPCIAVNRRLQPPDPTAPSDQFAASACPRLHRVAPRHRCERPLRLPLFPGLSASSRP